MYLQCFLSYFGCYDILQVIYTSYTVSFQILPHFLSVKSI